MADPLNTGYPPGGEFRVFTGSVVILQGESLSKIAHASGLLGKRLRKPKYECCFVVRATDRTRDGVR